VNIEFNTVSEATEVQKNAIITSAVNHAEHLAAYKKVTVKSTKHACTHVSF
jgi:hypothetical protein